MLTTDAVLGGLELEVVSTWPDGLSVVDGGLVGGRLIPGDLAFERVCMKILEII
jgi:hypothetical protein